MHYPDKKENVIQNEKQGQTENDSLEQNESIFFVDEIQIEEMAIDGICGVY